MSALAVETLFEWRMVGLIEVNQRVIAFPTSPVGPAVYRFRIDMRSIGGYLCVYVGQTGNLVKRLHQWSRGYDFIQLSATTRRRTEDFPATTIREAVEGGGTAQLLVADHIEIRVNDHTEPVDLENAATRRLIEAQLKLRIGPRRGLRYLTDRIRSDQV